MSNSNPGTGVRSGRLNEDDAQPEAERKNAGSAGLAAQQVQALLRRNFIERRRTRNTTFCEFFSPTLLLCVLVYGYSLSDVLIFPEKVYSSVELDLPGGLGTLLPLIRTPTKGDSWNNTWGVSNPADAPAHHDGTPGAGERGGEHDEDELMDFYAIDSVFREFTQVLDGPSMVPDLDTYVAVGSSVADSLDANAYAEVAGNMESGWTFGNLITQGTLHFAPAREPAVSELVSWLSNTSRGFDVLRHRVHESEEDAVAYALDHLEEHTWAVIALNEAEQGRVDYTIRMNFTVLPNTNEVVDMITIGLDPRYRMYYLSGFLTLQTSIDRFLFQRSLPPPLRPVGGTRGGAGQDTGTVPDEASISCALPKFVGVPFPTAAYDQNLFYAAVGYMLGLAMTMSTMYPLSRLVKGVVEEKESRVRETMRIMGLQEWTHELSWWITGISVFSFIALSVSTMLSWTFLPLADGGLLLLFVFSFMLSEVGLALTVAAVFSKAKLASIAAPCVLFAGVLPRYIFFGTNRHEAPRSKTLASLLSPTAFTFGADFIGDYEYAGIGANWGNYSDGEYSLRTSICMMLLDAVMYGLLAWYLDKVVPGEYGMPRDPLGFLWVLPKTCARYLATAWRRFSRGSGGGWTPVRTDSFADEESSGENEAGGGPAVGIDGDPEDFEALDAARSERVSAGVIISGLRKEFGDRVAVAGLDLQLPRGDITCLLGHNGAGKSTTISMLTGQLRATSGDAVVCRHSVRGSLAKVRQNLGICPQHDALMPLLTSREHLELYMDIKGMPPHLKGPLVTKMLRDVGLLEKEHALSSHLSGGQKRKLSVALALTGSPSLCILDEPTSGMDPYSRRFTWELLRRGRRGRCTLLSTHFMEEAEHLGDRVAMLRQGKLRCVGSPLFLKSRFGLGYKLTLVKAGRVFNEEQLTRAVREQVPSARPLSSAGGEISFRLPRGESKSFPGLFRKLETEREMMGVGGYGVSITSLEEVFLSLEKEAGRQIGRGTREGQLCDVVRGTNGVDGADSADDADDGGDSYHEGFLDRQDGGELRWGEGARPALEIEMHPIRVASPPSSRERSKHMWWPMSGHKRYKYQTSEDEEDESLLKEERDDEARTDRGSDGQQVQRPVRGTPGLRRTVTETTVGRRRRSRFLPSREDGRGRAPRAQYRSASPPRQGEGAGGATMWEQFAWLLWKRRIVAFRDWRGALYQVVLPALLVALVLMLLTIDLQLAGPSMVMSAEMFDGPTQVLFVEGGQKDKYAKVAEQQQDWTRLDPAEQPSLSDSSSTGLSRFLLDTYDEHDGQSRPPRYGAYVFGDRIPLNVTVDWDDMRENPDFLKRALELAGDVLPAEGGHYDVKELLDAAGVDEKKLAEAILKSNETRVGDPDVFDDALDFLKHLQLGPDYEEPLKNLNRTGEAAGNWTQSWHYLLDQDPTITFTDAEYLPESSELKLEGVELSVKNKTVNLGEVVVSVDAMLTAMPPGSKTYDDARLDMGGNATTVMFNTSAPHALSAWVGELTGRAFKACAKERGLEEEQASFVTRNHPLPLTATQSLEVQAILSLLVSILVTIPMCYAPAAFVTFLVKERACKSKRVQLVSGASPLAYWLSAYLWDVLLFGVLSVLVMLSFAAYGKHASQVFTMHWDAFFGTWGLVMSYGLSALPLSYLYSFAFDGPSMAQMSITGINFLSGFGFVIAYNVLSSLRKTMKFAERAQVVFRLFPPYLLGDGLIKVSWEFYSREVMKMERSSWGVLAWDVAGMGIVYMLMEALVYLGLVLALEYSLSLGMRSKVDGLRLRLGGWTSRDLAQMLAESRGAEDVDVKAERLRVEEALRRRQDGGDARDAPDTVLIKDLTKVYPAQMSSSHQRPKRAVRGLSLGVKKGECFGLLGINGAGKSTTLQILTRDLQATSGNLSVEGRPISSGAVCRLLGYCPQTDPLLELMTVKETLSLFGGLKGVGKDSSSGWSVGTSRRGPLAAVFGSRESSGAAKAREARLHEAVAKAMAAVSLGPTEGQLAGTLSGGNKRKLSLGVAIMGEPPVLLLDEPSSGMDPGARRSMWKVIASLSASRCVILTTHSMEECEAVCNRMGIMVGGTLRCIGTSQHLKARFGGGYTIEVRCPESSMPRVASLIRSLSPLARVEEMHPMLAKFSVSAGGGAHGGAQRTALSLGTAFEVIETQKEELEIWDYSINQATLETIFMSFAKDQEEETASVAGVAYQGENDGHGRGTNGSNGTGQSHSVRDSAPRVMDVEMGLLRDRGNRAPDPRGMVEEGIHEGGRSSL